VLCTGSGGGLKAIGYTRAQLDSITIYEYQNNSAHIPANLVGTFHAAWQYANYDTTNDTLISDFQFSKNYDIVITGSGLATTYNITDITFGGGVQYMMAYCSEEDATCGGGDSLQSYTINGMPVTITSRANAYMYLVR